MDDLSGLLQPLPASNSEICYVANYVWADMDAGQRAWMVDHLTGSGLPFSVLCRVYLQVIMSGSRAGERTVKVADWAPVWSARFRAQLRQGWQLRRALKDVV